MKKERESNFELLRIISMIMIIMWHLLLQANILDNSNGIMRLLLIIIEAIIVVHVNSFVLTTGYFQYKSTLKPQKIKNLILDVWFYKVFFLIIVLIFGLRELSKLDILLNLSPINHKEYWFMNCYLILYLLSPILNKIISKSERKELKQIVILLFIICSILSTISNQIVFNNEYGYSVSNFILLYFIGAYISKYNIKLKTKEILKYIVLLVSINVLLNYIGNYLLYKNSLFNYIGTIITSSSFVYDNPIVIIQSVLYFLLFSNFKLDNKIINKLSKTTIGVYLIHTNKLLLPYIYQIFGYNHFFKHKLFVIPLLILNSLLLFLICSFIEFIRIKLKKRIVESKWHIRLKEFIKNCINQLLEYGTEKDSYELLDLFKFIGCIMIVAIHTNLLDSFPEKINWYGTHLVLRFAVPFFFITSGFLYGNKLLKRNSNLKELNKKYLKRLLILLLFWLLIGLVPELYTKYEGSIFVRLFSMLKKIIFYPYGALWYIYALLIAIPLLSFFYKKKKYLLPIVIGSFLYGFALLCNSYYFLAEKNYLLKNIIDTYMSIFISGRNGIFVGILFVSIGVYISKLIKEKKINNWLTIYLLNILSFLILILEVCFVHGKSVLDDHSLFIITPLLSATIVLLLIKFSRHKQYKKLRNISIGVYLTHRPILAYLSIFITIDSNIILFIIILSLSILLTIFLQNRNNKMITQIIK